MNAVFVVVPGASLEAIASFMRRASLSVVELEGERLLVSDDSAHLYLFFENDLAQVPVYFRDLMEDSEAPDPVLVIEYSALSLLQNALTALHGRGDGVIDNDHGTVMSLGEFLIKLRAEPDWDWRLR